METTDAFGPNLAQSAFRSSGVFATPYLSSNYPWTSPHLYPYYLLPGRYLFQSTFLEPILTAGVFTCCLEVGGGRREAQAGAPAGDSPDAF